MGTLAKTFVVLNLVFCIAFVTVSATVLAQRTHWRDQHYFLKQKFDEEQLKWGGEKSQYIRLLETKQTELTTAQDTASKRADELVARDKTIKERDDAIKKNETDLAEANTRAGVLGQNIDRFTKDLLSTQKDLQTARQELATAKQAMDDRDTTLVGLRAQIASLELKQTELLHRLNGANEDIAMLNSFKEQVRQRDPSLYARIVQGGGTVDPVPPGLIRATVKAVDMNIKVVVLNVGSDTRPAAEKGYRFWIHRGRDFVAQVKVVSVEKGMCATEIIPPYTGLAVQVGDTARTEF